MTTLAIRIENLGKRDRIGQSDQPAGRFRYKSLRDSLVDTASRPWRVLTKHRRIAEQYDLRTLKGYQLWNPTYRIVGSDG